MLTALMRSGFLSGVANTLIVAADDEMQWKITGTMRGHGFEMRVVSVFDEADQLIREELIELIVVDYASDPQQAIAFCRRVRRDPSTCGITLVFVGSGVAEQQVVEGLWVGADAFVDLSIDASVVVAQLKSLIRRQAAGVCRGSEAHPNSPGNPATVRIGELLIDPRRFQAFLKGRLLQLKVGEFRVLYVLASHPGEVLSREQILQAMHGHEADISDRAIDARMYNIRKRLGEASGYIETVRGIGYRLRIPDPPGKTL